MRALKSFGVKFGRRAVFCRKLLRPDAASLLALLWGVRAKLDQIPPPPAPGVTSFDADDGAAPDGFLAAAGFRVVGPRAIRLDMLDRLEEELEMAATTGQAADAAVPKLVSLLGCDRATLDEVLVGSGLGSRVRDRRRSDRERMASRAAARRKPSPADTATCRRRAHRPTLLLQVWRPSSRRIDAMAERIRIDKWLWHARFYAPARSPRTAAVSGLIRLNGARVEKAQRGRRAGRRPDPAARARSRGRSRTGAGRAARAGARGAGASTKSSAESALDRPGRSALIDDSVIGTFRAYRST